MPATEFEMLLSEAETKLDRLRALYEQFFQGIERAEPAVLRKDFERRLHDLQRQKPRNTAMRFRLQTLQQRYTTLSTYWNRIGRQIEEGVRPLPRRRRLWTADQGVASPPASSRDVPRDTLPATDDDFMSVSQEIDLRELTEALRDYRRPDLYDTEPPPAEQEASPGVAEQPPVVASPPPGERRRSSLEWAVDSLRTVFPHRRTSPKPPSESLSFVVASSPPPPPPVLPSARLHQIYAEYVEARLGNRQSLESVSFEKLVRRIEAVGPSVQAKNPGKDVDFEVVVREGKVGLKPIVK